MQKERVLLNVKRFKQLPSECAIASAASIANYYDDLVCYRDVRGMLSEKEKRGGLWTSQQAKLLNDLGFTDVTIITAERDVIDFTWSKLSKDKLIVRLRKKAAYCGRIRDTYERDRIKHLADWLADEEYNNRLIIDWDFAKHIRRNLDAGRPVGAAIAWTTYWRKSKSLGKINDDIRGDPEDHAIVLRGYDSAGVFVVDSHTQFYNGRLKKYKNGYYKIPWEKFLVNIPEGDLIIVK